MKLLSYVFLAILTFAITGAFAQTGQIIEFGDIVLDPNQDGFISELPTGFSQDGYDPDEFETRMFGIPIFGDGEALNDIQAGQPCGVVDIALDTAGFAIYAGYDNDQNLIFRFRLAGDQESVQSYSIFMDTDQLVGAADPNSTAINPGFEIEITLIQRFGVYIFDVDGYDTCPTPLIAYDVDTHQQKSFAGTESCGDEDIYMDFYVPFSDLENFFGITPDTNVRFAGVTNISATCALDGKISDIGGVDDVAYDGCFSCAILDLTENQCPASVSNLCETCAGFPAGATATPTIDLPVIVGDWNVSGTAEEEAEIFIALYSEDDNLIDRDTIMSGINGEWQSTDFIAQLNFGDSITVNALLPGKCESGAFDTGLSFAIVSPNQPPQISGPGTTATYIENDPPLLFGTGVTVSDDNATLLSASVSISANYELDLDVLSLSAPPGISVNFDALNGELSILGEASIAAYQQMLRDISFQNLSEAPSQLIRTITYQVYDGTNFSPPYESDILITEQNDPPVIVIGNDPIDTVYFSTDEDVPLLVCIDAQDVDLDNLTISSIDVAMNHGTIQPDQQLCFIFSPEENYNGDEFLEVVICDDGDPALCDTVVVAIDIIPVNDPPLIINNNGDVIDSLFYTIEQATELSFCLESLDLEDDELIVESIEFDAASNSSLLWQSDLCFQYAPESSFIGSELAEITICDTGNPSRCTLLYVDITVEDNNLPPQITTTTADTLFIEMFENTNTELCLDATDPNDDVLDFGPFADVLGVGGTAQLTYSCLNYTPPLDFVGDVVFDISVCDDVFPAKCDQLFIKINVLPFNNPPQVVVENNPVDTVLFSTDENIPIELCLDVIDPDNDNATTSSIIKDSGDGTFTSDGSLCIDFTPADDSTGEVWGTVTICDDGDPSKCSETVIGVIVTPVNDPPIILLNGVEVDTLYQETSVNIPFEFCIDATDNNDDNLRVESITEVESGGFYTPGDTDLCLGFVPQTDFIGTALHKIIICDDGSPIACDTVYVEVNIAGNNNPPKILYNSVELDTINVSTLEDIPIELCLNAEDEDGDLVELTELSLLSGEGTAELDENVGEYCMTYTPSLGFFGDSYYGMLVCDNGVPKQCAYVVIHIEVLNQNNPPEVYQNGSVLDTLKFSTPGRTGLSACIEAIDKDGDPLSLNTPSMSQESGTISTNQNLCFDYSPADDFIGKDYFNITVCDNQDPSLCANAVIEIDVYSDNKAPKFYYQDKEVSSVNLSARERNSTAIDFKVEDTPGDKLALNDPSIESGLGNLESLLESGQITIDYTPDVLSKGMHRIVLTVCDDGLPQLCSSITLNIDVEEENVFPFQAISPNGDDLNDYWIIQGIEHYPDNAIVIFDRWNNTVFNIEGYNNSTVVWRGESNKGLTKTELNDGTYFYKITLGPGGSTLSGTVVLKR